MIVITALHIIKQAVQNYCIQSELLLTKSLAEFLSEHASGTSVFHEVLNWQNNNMSSLLQILSRWNHKCTVLYWAPMVQNRVEYYDHFLKNNVAENDHVFLQGINWFYEKPTREDSRTSDFFSLYLLDSENEDKLSLQPLPSLQHWDRRDIPFALQQPWAGRLSPKRFSTHHSHRADGPHKGTVLHSSSKASQSLKYKDF